jgi:hypothetical protein
MRKTFPIKTFLIKTFLILIPAFVLWLSPAETRAADRDTCIAYAGQATSKAVEDAMAVCGYRGDA